MTKKFNPLAQPGDIVWCKFPQILGVPGPKLRPALVIATFDNDHKIRVCYGTSQRLNQLHFGEYLFDAHDFGFGHTGLAVSTKFNLAQYVDLSFDSDWFAPDAGLVPASPLPLMGSVHPSVLQTPGFLKAVADHRKVLQKRQV